MNASFIALLVVLVFVAGAEARVASDRNNLLRTEVTARYPTGGTATITTTRLLRSYEVAGGATTSHDEDRVNVPAMSIISEKVSSSTQYLTNKVMLALNKDPDEAFKALRLHTSGAKIDKPTFLQWMQHVEKYRAEKGFYSFSDLRVFELLRASKSDEELVALFQALRRLPGKKDFANQMERFLFESSVPSHKLLIKAWLKSGQTPADTFYILNLRDARFEGNQKFLQWLRFTEEYKASVRGGKHSDLRTYNFLMRERPLELDLYFATLFQWVRQTPDLKKVDGNYVLMLPKDDARYKALEAYTIYYAAERSGQTAKKAVTDLFAMDKRVEALAAAMKS
ncbi:hypothetical protein PF005_g27111 [Phytophthora fragariae]|uniref:Uncharacterized protein n=1 Tax=Phytophthora fragariae TaxID=53985 RepID=A0A6A3HNY3_9STRA|nr:hypothetical protein PF009_g17862 [Phytophthora fragariae]KAE8971361.1 hypothetical protein PF011_g26061 [Phytophthora fragariae]KAE9069505.1 hypothetical protein PF010_g26640 [Phytophthora fragariae]KAE9096900.1 hypothetical protein PF007_g16809 [Phytophthora fragariae]KAE9131103.1 hypothetical protein PF006_g15602 [Phytophthora fragariae]